MLRKIAKILMWVLVGVVGLLVLAWLVFVIFFPDEKLRRMLVARLQEQLEVPVAAGALDLEILSGLVLTDVVLGPPAGFERAPVRVERLVVDYSLADILSGAFHVERVLLERPVIVLETSGGRTSLQAVFAGLKGEPDAEAIKEQQDTGDGFVIDLQDIAVRDARVQVRTGAFEADLTGIDLDLSGRLGGGTHLRLAGRMPLPAEPNFTVQLAAGALRPTRAAAGIRFAGNIDTSRAELNGAVQLVLQADGTFLPGPHDLQAAFRVQADLGKGVIRLDQLDVRLDDAPLLTATGFVDGLEATPRARMDIEQLTIGGGWLRHGIEGLEVDGQIRFAGVQIETALDDPLPRIAGALEIEQTGVAIAGRKLAGLNGKLGFTLRPAGDAGTLQLDGDLRARAIDAGQVHARALGCGLRASASLEPAATGWSLAGTRVDVALDAEQLMAAGAAGRGVRLSGRFETAMHPVQSGAGGLRVPRPALSLQARAASVRIAGQLVRAPSVSLSATADEAVLPADGNVLLAEPRAELKLGAHRLSSPAVTVDRPRLEASVRGHAVRLAERFDDRLAVDARLRAGGVQAGEASVEAVDLQLHTRLGGLRPESLPVRMVVGGTSLALARGHGQEPVRLPGALEMGLKGRLKPRQGLVEIEHMTAELSGLAKFAVGGRLDLHSRAAELHVDLAPVRLSPIAELLPAALRSRLPPVTGTVAAKGLVSGRLPAGSLELERATYSFDLDLRLLGLSAGMQRPRWKLDGLAGQVHLQADVAGAGRIQRARADLNLEVQRASVGKAGPRAEGLQAVLGVVRKPAELGVDGRLVFSRLRLPGVLSVPLEKSTVVVDGRLLGSKEIQVRRLVLEVPTIGTGITVSGQVVRPTGTGARERMRASGRLEARLRAPRAVVFPGGLTARGEADLGVEVTADPSGVWDLRGAIAFGGLSLQSSSFALVDMQGAVPVAQRLRMIPAPVLLADEADRKAAPASRASRAYQEALLPMKGSRRSFAIASLHLGGLIFDKVSGNLEIGDGRLHLGSLRFAFLGGDVLADAGFVFAPDDTRRVSLDAELSGVDVSELGALTLAGSSDISGNLRLELDFNQKVFSASTNLTHIGRSTLQAVLAGIDPTGSNPGVEELSSFLTKHRVSPRRVSLHIRHGLLRLEVVFREMGLAARAAAGLIKGFSGTTFRLPSIQVGGLISKYLGF